jgi:hypothetical protein
VRSVASRPYDETVVEYALLMEHEYLAGAQETDARYHLARLIAQGFNGGAQVIWDEHQQVRATYLNAAQMGAPAREMSREELLAAVARIHRKMQGAGLVSPSGAVN